jgi:anhydro-N-acetylmuramic acid kinase
LTARSITQAIHQAGFADYDVFVCGGGVHNQFLMQRLNTLHATNVLSTSNLGLDPDWVEAIAFAWFAKNTLARKNSSLAKITGATRASILGGIFYP